MRCDGVGRSAYVYSSLFLCFEWSIGSGKRRCLYIVEHKCFDSYFSIGLLFLSLLLTSSYLFLSPLLVKGILFSPELWHLSRWQVHCHRLWWQEGHSVWGDLLGSGNWVKKFSPCWKGETGNGVLRETMLLFSSPDKHSVYLTLIPRHPLFRGLCD